MNPDEKSFLVAVGSRLASVRRDRGLTQSELAERVGLDTRSIQRFEGGQSAPSLLRLSALAGELGTSPGELLPNRSRSLAMPRAMDGDVPSAIASAWAKLSPRQRVLATALVRTIAQHGEG